MADHDHEDPDSDPPMIALAITASVVIVVASYVTATLVHALLGRDGVPVSPLLLVIPAIPIFLVVMRIDERTPPGRAKDRILLASFLVPLALAVLLVVVVPLPVMTGSVPVGGAFGLTIASCVVAVAVIIARGRWKDRSA